MQDWAKVQIEAAKKEHGIGRKRTKGKRRIGDDEYEADIQKAILKYLLYLPKCKVIRSNNIGVPIHKPDGTIAFRKSPVDGLSDILICYRSLFLAIEVKRPGKEPTDDQDIFLSEVEAAEGISLVAYSLDDVIDLINSIDKELAA